MANKYGIDESTFAKQILKKRIDSEKEKIFQKMYKTDCKDKLNLYKKELNSLDDEYNERLKHIEMVDTDKCYKSLTQFIDFKSRKCDDNINQDYIDNFIEIIRHSKYSKLLKVSDQVQKRDSNHEIDEILVCPENNIFKEPIDKLNKNKEFRINDALSGLKNNINLKPEDQIQTIDFSFTIDDILALQKSVFFSMRKEAHVINELYVPIFIWDYIFDYQKFTISWLLKLYNAGDGGILADEMGLGKTLQIISFVSALFVSLKIRYCLIVCPTTIFDQWILEWKKYFPFIRICILHSNYTTNIQKLIDNYLKSSGVLFVSYAGFKNYQKKLKKIKFEYMILDEGHKIKNKDADISKVMCAYRCENKIVLTGTPIQNNLKELWAIFDFLNPGKLGTYASFNEEYEDPINKGQYSSAKPHMIEKAYKRTVLLRNIINPFILRRLKTDVANQLPKKIDKIVFCRMTEIQEKLYKELIESEYSMKILMGKISSMNGLITLRRICNHPFLYQKELESDENLISSSTKLINIDKMLIDWKNEGKKVLIFTQMLDTMNLLERFIKIRKYNYISMSGRTSLNMRGTYISQFNNDVSIFIFLLTTRVGGLGLNLVGASRVIIYDPDWNPTTDSQAKERAYRYGQTQNVEIYRFITMDTIEEKIYEKQMFKDVLSLKVLKNPSLSKLFKKNDLNDMFSYFKRNQQERIEEINDENSEKDKDIIDVFMDKIDPKIIERMDFLRNKEILNDNEMIEYIYMREEHDI